MVETPTLHGHVAHIQLPSILVEKLCHGGISLQTTLKVKDMHITMHKCINCASHMNMHTTHMKNTHDQHITNTHQELHPSITHIRNTHQEHNSTCKVNIDTIEALKLIEDQLITTMYIHVQYMYLQIRIEHNNKK